MNKKSIVVYFIIILSLITFISLFSNLHKAMNKVQIVYNDNNIKLSKIEYSIKKNNSDISSMKQEIEKKKNSLNEKNDKKVSLENQYKEKLKSENKESNGVGKIIYLTFDDGPSYLTDSILDILDKYNVKATFFMTCKDNTKEYAKKMKEKGHTVALHTCSHDYGEIYSSIDNYFNDLDIINNMVKEGTDTDTRYIRFPGGSSNTVSKFNKGIMTTLTNEVKTRGYKYYDWNIDSMDASGYSATKEYEHVITSLRFSDRKTNMILMHDIKISTRDSLERIILDSKNMGYEFSKITDFTPEIHHGINN